MEHAVRLRHPKQSKKNTPIAHLLPTSKPALLGPVFSFLYGIRDPAQAVQVHVLIVAEHFG